MEKVSLYVLAIFFFLVNVSCSKRAVFTYIPDEKTATAPSNAPLPLTVAVKPFQDARGQNNTNNQFFCVIPFVPYCSLSYDRPDAANRFLFVSAYAFHPVDDFSRAVADEIKKNRFFKKVIFPLQVQEQGADLVLTGKIMETRYYGENASYGFSLWAPLLWYIGLPAGKVHNTVILSMEIQRSSDGAVVWSHVVRGEWSEIVGLYYHWAADFEGFPVILRQGLHQGMEKLADDIRTRDLNYHELP
jgi:hypothetical protein